MSDDIRLLGASTVEQAVRNFGGHVDQFERNLRYFDEIVSRFELAVAMMREINDTAEQRANERASREGSVRG
jgi:hypothetical protein